jgi:EF hand domain-containing protein
MRLHRRTLRVAALLIGIASAGAFGQGPGGNTPRGTAARIPQIYSPEKVHAAFQSFDRDGNGWLSFRELRAALGIDRREFLVFDANHDGAVAAVEFDAQVRKLMENGAVLRLPGRAASQPAPADTSASSRPTPSPAKSGPFQFGDMKDFGDKKSGGEPASKPAVR